MKYTTGAFIVLFCVTALLIAGFKHITAEATITTKSSYLPAVQKEVVITIQDIPLPEGFTRIKEDTGTFAEWLRNFPLKKDNTVRLYNGQPVEQQYLHYTVLNLSTGDKDLQQCADAVMRLRAEYFFSRREYNKICFAGGPGTIYNYTDFARKHGNWNHDGLMKFMETVFINCGTYTVDDMTQPRAIKNIQPGDVFVKAGAPGHAMIVADVAENATGERVFLLAQSFMPAQDMHIVINPVNATLSPWYNIHGSSNIETPGWVFEKKQLKTWK